MLDDDIVGTPEFDALYFDDDVDMSQQMSAPNPTFYDKYYPNPYINNDETNTKDNDYGYRYPWED